MLKNLGLNQTVCRIKYGSTSTKEYTLCHQQDIKLSLSLSLESDCSITGYWGHRAPSGLATSGSLMVSENIWQGTEVRWTGDEPCRTQTSWLLRTSAGQPWCLRCRKSAGPCHNSPTLLLFQADFARHPDTPHAGRCAKPTGCCSGAPRTTSSCFGPVWHLCPDPFSAGWHRPRPQPRRSCSLRPLPSSCDRLWQGTSPERNTPYQTGEDALELNYR